VNVLLQNLPRVFEVVDESTLLHELELVIDTDVFHLLFGVSKMRGLLFFYLVNPLVGQLLELVARVDVVEDGKLRSEQECKVARLDETNVPGDQELVVEDHTTEPFVVGPASHSCNSCNRSDVREEEDKATTRSRERLVMGRYLLWAYSFEKSAQVIVVSEDKGIRLTVIRVHESFAHRFEFVLVVCLGIGLVLRLWSIETNGEKLAFVKRHLYVYFQGLNISGKQNDKLTLMKHGLQLQPGVLDKLAQSGI